MDNKNLFSLEGKTILVTGASSGIGQSVAVECSKAGAKVIISARNELRLEETYNQLQGEGHRVIVADLSDYNDIEKLVNECSELDGLSNNAGIAKGLLIRAMNKEYFDDIMKTNAYGPILLTQLLFRKKKLNVNSSIVFTSSLSGVYIVSQGEAAYAASKGAISGFAKGAALEFAVKGIRVNCVNPCIIVTDLFKRDGIFVKQEQIDEAAKNFPLQRLGKPQDVAMAHVFLLSGASSWITGINLPIDGGFTLR
jgi:NAD(P)-dependent dehydrogenase (short-subunit alcohol dehydrogenase family)